MRLCTIHENASMLIFVVSFICAPVNAFSEGPVIIRRKLQTECVISRCQKCSLVVDSKQSSVVIKECWVFLV
ncbi:hypothetical protein F5Y08DRAFT_152993 [Xylaria arbuscula]|nr:hypothetical protein F5Y08DRAFT_152993 [Xylaria arbuscula]